MKVVNHTPGESVDAVMDRIMEVYLQTGHIPEEILTQVEERAWRTGRPLRRDQIREAFVRVLERRHQMEGYKPKVTYGPSEKVLRSDEPKVEGVEVRMPRMIVRDLT